MIQPYSRLKVADNTGAKETMCIRTERSAKAKAAKIGDIITVAVKSATPQASVKKKEIAKAVIVRQRQILQRPDGTSIRFDDNAIVLINADKTPRGTRIFGPVARELRERGFNRIVSMAVEVI